MHVLVVAEKGFCHRYRSLAVEPHTHSACTPYQCLTHIQEQDVDLVLLDCSANLDMCLDVLRKIKTLHPRIPVIVFAERGSENFILAAFKSGARDVFIHPISIAEVQNAVEGILSLKKSSVEIRRPFSSSALQSEFLPHIGMNCPTALLGVIRHIEGNLAAPVSLATLAEKAGMSKYHFCRFFKRHIGLTPKQYILSRRVERAKKLLREGTLLISSIASAVGFSDVGSFTVQFKKFTGTTPLRFKISLTRSASSAPQRERQDLPLSDSHLSRPR